MFASLGLVGRYSVAKDIEILILCHQLAVVQRCDPRISRKLNGADHSWLALLAGLLGRQLQRHHLRMGCGRPATDRRDRSNADDRSDLPSRAGRYRHDRSRRGGAVWDPTTCDSLGSYPLNRAIRSLTGSGSCLVVGCLDGVVVLDLVD
jgi:hypothetical protein